MRGQLQKSASQPRIHHALQPHSADSLGQEGLISTCQWNLRMLLFCVRVIGCVRLQCTVRRALGCACKRYVLYRRQREMGLGVRVSGRGGEGAAARAPNIARRSLRALSSGPWMRDLFAYGRRAPRFPFFRNGRRRNLAAAEWCYSRVWGNRR